MSCINQKGLDQELFVCECTQHVKCIVTQKYNKRSIFRRVSYLIKCCKSTTQVFGSDFSYKYGNLLYMLERLPLCIQQVKRLNQVAFAKSSRSHCKPHLIHVQNYRREVYHIREYPYPKSSAEPSNIK